SPSRGGGNRAASFRRPFRGSGHLACTTGGLHHRLISTTPPASSCRTTAWQVTLITRMEGRGGVIGKGRTLDSLNRVERDFRGALPNSASGSGRTLKFSIVPGAPKAFASRLADPP